MGSSCVTKGRQKDGHSHHHLPKTLQVGYNNGDGDEKDDCICLVNYTCNFKTFLLSTGMFSIKR